MVEYVVNTFQTITWPSHVSRSSVIISTDSTQQVSAITVSTMAMCGMELLVKILLATAVAIMLLLNVIIISRMH